MNPLRVGVIGCGNISGIYLENLGKFESTTIVACADLVPERAEAAAEKARNLGSSAARASSVGDLLASDDVELVLNLTLPKSHVAVNILALEAGKHVYCEKPLGLNMTEATAFMQRAREAKTRVGCAPDTVLGAGIQTARKLIDEGAIGKPIGASANMICHGHEGWHPDPAFYYELGGGPLLDMGPYYYSALVTLLGSITAAQYVRQTTFGERTIGSDPKRGQKIRVETPTHILGQLEFGDDCWAQITMSFDVWAHRQPMLEIYGTEGSLSVPDPNGFGGPVEIWTPKSKAWETVPLAFPYAENSRGLGVLDMAHAIAEGRPHRASAELAFHILEAMLLPEPYSLSSKSLAPLLRPDPMPVSGL